MLNNNIYQHKPLKERQGTPQALNNSVTANHDDNLLSKRNVACRSGNTRIKQRGRMSAHTVFVLGVDGKPLTPTTPAKARKLLKSSKAKKVWSKFNTFGIQMLQKTRQEVPNTSLGHDPGSKYEGYSIVCGDENSLNIMWLLPIKEHIVRKIKERMEARRFRRRRIRRRKARYKNRIATSSLAPSQKVIVLSRLKCIRELIRIYPIATVAYEKSGFVHNVSYGKNFSTMAIGRTFINNFIINHNITLKSFSGFETKQIREKYDFIKNHQKEKTIFNTHCSDSLSLAIECNNKKNISIGPFLSVDDSYRFVRRKLFKTNTLKNNIRKHNAKGTIKSLKKGIIVGFKNGNGILCGEYKNMFRVYLNNRVRKCIKNVYWINNGFNLLCQK